MVFATESVRLEILWILSVKQQAPGTVPSLSWCPSCRTTSSQDVDSPKPLGFWEDLALTWGIEARMLMELWWVISFVWYAEVVTFRDLNPVALNLISIDWFFFFVPYQEFPWELLPGKVTQISKILILINIHKIQHSISQFLVVTKSHQRYKMVQIFKCKHNKIIPKFNMTEKNFFFFDKRQALICNIFPFQIPIPKKITLNSNLS